MAKYIHVIERRSDGWSPSMRTIRRVLRIAKRKGFRSDWNYAGILETGAICFADISADDSQADLVAIKLSGEYHFMTEREYLDLNLRGANG
ncbi:MAG: hypothetical protein JWQ87_2278 [Candidatus Sulfotelmatobacter sp.]|nr:hypothetical protein [Candidatus Sulfotelmatobacter sp.]